MKTKAVRQFPLHTLVAAVSATAILTSVTIFAAADLSQTEKVQLCHRTDNSTIIITRVAAESHLRLHPGDYYGQCAVAQPVSQNQPQKDNGYRNNNVNQRGTVDVGANERVTTDQTVTDSATTIERPPETAVDAQDPAIEKDAPQEISVDAGSEQSAMDRFLGKLPVTGISIGLFILLTTALYYGMKVLKFRK